MTNINDRLNTSVIESVDVPGVYGRVVHDALGRSLYNDTQAGKYAVRLDDVGGGVTYIGKAAAGALTSAASWQVQKMTETSTTLKIEFADGDILFNNIWDNRVSLTYS